MAHLHDLLEEAFGRFPDRICLIEAGQQRFDYTWLMEKAQEFETVLRNAGVGPGDRVGVAATKSARLIAALFGIMRLGAAYVPVDPSAPAARSAGIFHDCQVAALICGDDECAALEAEIANRFPIDRVGECCGLNIWRSASKTPKSPEGTAYILYTSGSTGKPKGVTHTHASALGFVEWCSQTFDPNEASVFSSHAPVHFDLSILDIYVPIKHGGAIRLIASGEAKNPAALVEMIAADRITNWYSTPTVLRTMMEFGRMDSQDLSSLEVVCFAGEVFPPKQLRAFAALVPHPQYHNLYGPTETNVCTAYHCERPDLIGDDMSIPIGFATSGDRLRVIDPDGVSVANGETGELVVAGSSVMVGYWNNPERNASAFVELDDGSYYRTGDLVVAREDGALIYHGRSDRMVKRRGYRIELDEIEAAMVLHDEISDGASVALTDEASGDVRIFHFFAVAPEVEKIGQIALKKHASSNLPIYMVPDRIVQIDAIPMTSTDKVDYQKLLGLARGL